MSIRKASVMLKKLIIGLSATAAIAASQTAATQSPVAKPGLNAATSTQDTPSGSRGGKVRFWT